MRVATAGLAASESTIPVSISTASAASISRSTVHHQFAYRVRSTRETMEALRQDLQSKARLPTHARARRNRAFACPTLPGHGLRRVNARSYPAYRLVERHHLGNAERDFGGEPHADDRRQRVLGDLDQASGR